MRIESVSFKPDDVIIVQFPYDRYEIDTIRQIADSINNIFSENKILLIPEDLTLSVFSKENMFI